MPWDFFKKKPKVEQQAPVDIPATQVPVETPTFDEADKVINQTPVKQNKNVVYIKDIKITGNTLVKTEDILNAMSAKQGMAYDK